MSIYVEENHISSNEQASALQEAEQFDTLPVPSSETQPSIEPFHLEGSTAPADSPEIFEDDAFQQEEADEAQAAVNQLIEDAKETEAATREDEEKRAAHEAAEKKRKAEWEARQQEKKATEAETLRQIATMTDEALITASMNKVAEDTERLTRRNMKCCVMEWIQTKCLDDPAFARLTMHPQKTMIRCFHYINRKAEEYVKQEMTDNDIPQQGIYGSDVPDDLCYLWAEQYFQDADTEEDKENEEKFVAKPYISTISGKNTSRKKSEKKTPAAKTLKSDAAAKKAAAAEKEELNIPGQISLFDPVQEVTA